MTHVLGMKCPQYADSICRIRSGHRACLSICNAQRASSCDIGNVDRRTSLQLAGGMLLQAIPVLVHPGSAEAAGLGDAITRVFPPPPQPVLFPRKALGQAFAVLLMRSSYEAVDSLDYIPMDSFQVKFWKFRQAEQEGYNLQYLPLRVRLGDLTDPLYFDFISHAQYAVIGQEMGRGQQVFKEFCEECEGQQRVVRRDPAYADNALLPARFNDLVGDAIYTGLRYGFRGQQFGAPGPAPPGSGLAAVCAGVQELLDVMVGQGYALKASVLDVAPGPGRSGSFRVRLEGPANLWGLASLSFRRSPVVNTYDAMLTRAYLRASGWGVTSFAYTYTDTAVEEEWVVG